MPTSLSKIKTLISYVEKLPRNDNLIRDEKTLPYPKSELIEAIFDYIRLDFRSVNYPLYSHLLVSLSKHQADVGKSPTVNNMMTNPKFHKLVSLEEYALKDRMNSISQVRDKSHAEFEASYFAHINRFD